jgi:hypothetical protein
LNDKGTQRGITADLMLEFERNTNPKHAWRLDERPLAGGTDPDHARRDAR